ncbi:MAG: response regulator, partial [Xenococcaceae cyanobacterium MO_188.B19]|nr:response regulator [Xenococcaceae cyanobacterium MO_188.B19]
MNQTKILIVEDELLIAKNLANKLKKFKYEVVAIISYGQEAIEFVDSNQPDLVLMDIAIKGKIDGIETASIIRKNHDIPIIYLTAYADDQTLERASKTGAYGYIMKPFKERELHATIKMALMKHQEQSILKESFSYYCSERKAIYNDSLTNLPNQLLLRDLFKSLLSEEPTKSLEDNQKTIGVFYLDLDRFLRVREYLDNKQENSLIQSVAQRLTQCTHAFCSEAILFRLEHCQFAVLLPNIKDRQAAADFAQILLQQINQPFLLQEKELFLTASIGVSFYPLNNIEIEELLKQAKQAMIYAQQQGGNQYNFYTIAFKLM